MFELRNKIRDLKQGNIDVTQYFNALTKVGQELDLFNNGGWKCADDEAHY